MKAFLCLALPAEHPFWRAAEKPFAAPSVSLQKRARLLYTRSDDKRHVIAFEAGNHAREHAHNEAKYEKFAYSTVFGFSVPKAPKLLKDGAFERTLAVSDDNGDSWRPRYGCERYELTQSKVSFTWKPYLDVVIDTELLPIGEWHVRRHHIINARAIEVAEGGFAIARDDDTAQATLVLADMACVTAPWGVSAVKSITGFDYGEIIILEPNTNLMTSRTLLPTLRAALKPGEHTLVSVVFGSTNGSSPLEISKEVLDRAKLG